MIATQAKKAPKKPKKKKKVPRRVTVSFDAVVKRISDRLGKRAAQRWAKAMKEYQRQINDDALRSAVAAGDQNAIEAVISPDNLQRTMKKALEPPFVETIRATGRASAQALTASGVSTTFEATHANVVLYAREQAAQLVVDVPKDTRAIIAEIIARGAERGLTVDQQARAIRQVVGLPPNWARAPGGLADELESGNISKALGRKMSGRLKQQIRSRARAGTIDEEFIRNATNEYTRTLINQRANMIARTESLRAANYGLTESWRQAQAEGALPENTRRIWIVTPDDRLSPEHARIPGMNPDGRRMGEPFMTPEGVFMEPPTRPNCRCSIGLTFKPPAASVAAPSTTVSTPAVAPAPIPTRPGFTGPVDYEDFDENDDGFFPPEGLKLGSIDTEHAADPTPMDVDIMLNEFGQVIREQDYESSAVYNKDGETLIMKDGESHSVEFVGEELNQMRDNFLTHNHPNSSSFSSDDVAFAINHDLQEMRAVGKNGTEYRIIRPVDGRWPSLREVAAVQEQVLAEMYNYYHDGASAAEQRHMENPLQHYHIQWQNVFERVGIYYERKLPGGRWKRNTR